MCHYFGCQNFEAIQCLFEGLIECIKFAQDALMKQSQTLDHQNTVDLDPAMGKLIPDKKNKSRRISGI